MNNIKPLLANSQYIEGFDPSALVDGLLECMNMKNDAALSRALALSPAVVSKLRHNRMELTASLILRIHDVSGMPINEIRTMACLPIPEFSTQESAFSAPMA